MSKKRLTVIHDEEDQKVCNEIAIVLAVLSKQYGIEIKSYILTIDTDNLKERKVDVEKAGEIEEIFFNSTTVIVLLSSTTTASLELDYAFKENENLCDKKEIYFIISRHCSWQDCDWIKKGTILPIKEEPLLVYNKDKREQIYCGLLIALRQVLDNSGSAPENERFRVFISYSHRDGFFADLLRYKLAERKIPVALDIDYLIPGEKWKAGIDYEIDRCSIVLLVLSSNSKESEYVMYEWAYAMGLSKTIVPVLIESIDDLHPKLQELENFRGLIDRKNAHWEQLYEIIERHKKSLEIAQLLEKDELREKETIQKPVSN